MPADRDFELTWKPAAENAPSVGLFRERVGDADYLLAFVTPPAVEQADEKPLPREAIFVIDNSGSMGGTSMVQAKASLIYALGRLQPADRFNVIRFDDTMDVLFPDTVPADAENLAPRQGLRRRARGARRHRDGAADAGGADRPAQRDDASFVRQVVFLTDGAIGNEQQLFDTIAAMRGRSRVFMVGIGSAPNSFLMTRAAEIGRGTFTHIGSVEQVEERMRALFDKLESPAVTNLTATFSDAQGRHDAGGAARSLSRRAAGAGGAARPARRHRSRSRAASATGPWIVTLPLAQRRRRQGPVQALGAAQDRRRRGRPDHAAGSRRRRPTSASSRSRSTISS